MHLLTAETIDGHQFQDILGSGIPVEENGGRPRILKHPDGLVTKIWKEKNRFFSSSRFWPYSTRFVKNQQALLRRGVTVPELTRHAKVHGAGIRLVQYRRLEGLSVREALVRPLVDLDPRMLAGFIARLHKNGILFRSIHFGNILKLQDGGFSLIDFSNIRFYSNPLTMGKRIANLIFPFRYSKDIGAWEDAGLPCLIACYLEELE
jgi:hypothetical protein